MRLEGLIWLPFASPGTRRGVGAVLAAVLCAYSAVVLLRLRELAGLPLHELAVVLSGWACAYTVMVWAARQRGRIRRRFDADPNDPVVGDYAELLRKWSLGWDSHMGAAAQERWAIGVEEFLVRNALVR